MFRVRQDIFNKESVMKNIKIVLLYLLISSLYVSGQNSKTKKADLLFSKFEFLKAAETYKNLITNGKKNTYVFKQLAECYYNIFNTEEAEFWYAKVLQNSNDSETIYKYAQMLKANKKLKAYNTQMQKFIIQKPKDNRALAYKNNPSYINKLLKNDSTYTIKNVAFNTKQSDFGGILQDSILYFTSGRHRKGKNYAWNQQPFLDIYTLDKNSNTLKSLDNIINTKYNEGLVSFSPDGNTMFFSRESFYEKDFQKKSKFKYSQLYIYKATKVSNEWTDVKGLSINNKNYTVKNPSVSQDGKTLYFASNMPNGFGNFDIYKSSIKENGTLGKPKNLGPKINTNGQEMFPFISNKDILYFSSDTHLGLGGMDVFYSKMVNQKFTEVKNIGIPINSNADDFAFYINEDTQEGYISSNRNGGKGSDDIYAIKKDTPCSSKVDVIVLDSKTNNSIPNATVTIVSSIKKYPIATTNKNGLAQMIADCEEKINLQVDNSNYESQLVTIENTPTQTIYLKPLDDLIQDNKIILNPIYFDFDKSNITALAAFELDKLIQILKRYPDMVIHTTSHTDSRGSNPYNMKLSDRRSKSTVQYVISKGISEHRISGAGKGETEHKINCENKCTKEEHQLNRRSEFNIISGNPNIKK